MKVLFAMAALVLIDPAPLGAPDMGEPQAGQIETSPATPEAPLPQTAGEDPTVTNTGRIVIYRRESIMGFGIACPVRYQGRELVELGRGKFAEWTVEPGRYILSNKTASVELSVDSGESRYVRCQVKTGFLTGRADLQVVDNVEFDELQPTFERKEVYIR